MTLKVTHMLSKEKMQETLLFFGLPMVTIFGLTILVSVKVAAELRLDTFFSILVFLFVLLMGNMLFITFQLLMMELGQLLPSPSGMMGKTDKRKGHIYDNKHHIYNNECAEESSTNSQRPFPLFSCEAYSKRYAEAERQRERRKAERQKAISEYILYTMSPYAAPDELAVLHDELTAWTLDSAHKPKPVNLRDKQLTTMDLRHFIWNIAERLEDSKNYNGHNRARFTKALFPDTFADTEIDSIRNFTVNPNSGIIRIDRPDKGCFMFHYDAEDKMIH